ncbi:FixH family protein [Tepidiphilus baoligensis]|uniref:Nitrogen fixation protein FixH n=1 Tax=Tepidiphilus baoligensis TaxID=2698687 RepID=A0ABX1QHS1_9PROT|nr:FixH family protein [Tepidiphilus baoligensis]NMH15638.1 nitrogen fixation protein FixH [Tepidiphilus baoligensis]
MEARISSRNSSQTLPWYRQKWPWLLMLPPAVAVVAGFATLWIAIATWDGLVTDDYYKEGLAIRQTLDRSLKAGELGLVAYVGMDAERLWLRFDEERAKARPPFLVVTLTHPTRSGMDQVVRLVRDQGRYVAPIQPINAGRWLVQIEDESREWRLNGTVYVPTESEVRIEPFVPAAD